MLFTYNQAPFRWLLLPVLWLPSLIVSDLYTAMMTWPCVALATVLLWMVPTKIVVVAPEDVDDAFDEIPDLVVGTGVSIAVYRKSAKAFMENITLPEDFDPSDLE
jgi:hypothetical protein